MYIFAELQELIMRPFCSLFLLLACMSMYVFILSVLATIGTRIKEFGRHKVGYRMTSFTIFHVDSPISK